MTGILLLGGHGLDYFPVPKLSTNNCCHFIINLCFFIVYPL